MAGGKEAVTAEAHQMFVLCVCQVVQQVQSLPQNWSIERLGNQALQDLHTASMVEQLLP